MKWSELLQCRKTVERFLAQVFPPGYDPPDNVRDETGQPFTLENPWGRSTMAGQLSVAKQLHMLGEETTEVALHQDLVVLKNAGNIGHHSPPHSLGTAYQSQPQTTRRAQITGIKDALYRLRRYLPAGLGSFFDDQNVFSDTEEVVNARFRAYTGERSASNMRQASTPLTIGGETTSKHSIYFPEKYGAKRILKIPTPQEVATRTSYLEVRWSKFTEARYEMFEERTLKFERTHGKILSIESLAVGQTVRFDGIVGKILDGPATDISFGFQPDDGGDRRQISQADLDGGKVKSLGVLFDPTFETNNLFD